MTGWASPSANTLTLTRYERQKFHDAVFARSSSCAWCGAAATQADHIRPIAQGGDAYDPSNGQPLCTSCHDEKSKRERLVGQASVGARRRGSARRPADVHPGLVDG